jgi:hypothetical protein
MKWKRSRPQLKRLLEEAIRSVLDIDAYNRECDAETADAHQLDAARESARTLLQGIDLSEI